MSLSDIRTILKSKTSAHKWVKLTPLPCPKGCNDVQASEAVMINENEMIMAPHWPNKTHNDELKEIGLFKYNIINDEWTLWMRYNSDYNPQWNRICVDNKCNKIYSTGNRSSMTIIDLHHKTYFKQNVPNIGSGAAVIMVDSVCHIIGGGKSNKHYIWNEKIYNFEQIFEFNLWGDGCTGFKVVHIKSQNKLLLFGGYLYGIGRRKNEIWSHELGTKIWFKLPQTIPYAMNSFGIVVTSDEKYAITFGGFEGHSMSQIIVIDLKTLVCNESSIQVPKVNHGYSLYHAIKWHEKANNDMLINGFIRLYHAYDYKHIPSDVIKLIARWYSIEYVLLISTRGHLWIMAISDILSATKLL